MLDVGELIEKYNIVLDEEQKRAAFSDRKNILLLAVPGSGKTTVMIARLGYLVKCRAVSPSSILAVTYSVAGAGEMQKRYISRFGDDGIRISTIHSLCVSVIDTYCKKKHSKPFELMTEEGMRSSIVRGIMRSNGSYPTDSDVNDALTKITYCANMMLSDEEIKEKIELEGRDFSELYGQYRQYKIDNHLMDFDDQLVYALKVLRAYPKIRDQYAMQYAYICVDEAQDTSYIQHQIIDLLCSKGAGLFMVGDEDQSIYGFRAAYPDALMSFEKDREDAEVFLIEKNYRSTGKIVASADRFISRNENRRKKNMKADGGEGIPPIFRQLPNLGLIPDYLLQKVQSESFSSLAVLARQSDSLIPTIDLFSEKGIRFNLRGRDSLFFSHFVIQDIKDIIAFSEDPYDASLFIKLYYKFCCGLTRTEAENAVANNSGKKMLPFPEYIEKNPIISEKKRIKMHFIAAALRSMPSKNMLGKLKAIIDGTGYGEYLLDRPNDMVKIRALYCLADRHSSKEDFYARLSELEAEIKNGFSGGNITLSTIHSVKGMEFEQVVIIDAYNGIMPSIPEDSVKKTPLSVEERRTVEEDRRIFYVGMTRAAKQLELLTAKSNYGIPLPGTEYVDQLRSFASVKEERDPEKTVKDLEGLASEYSAGDRIIHRVFGYGNIVSVSVKSRKHFASLVFDNGGKRRLCLEECVKREIIEKKYD